MPQEICKVNNFNFPTGTGLSDAGPCADYRLAAIPLSCPRATAWTERLARWRALRDAPLFLEDGRTRAARQAETVTGRLVSVHHTVQFGHVFSSKRIPRDVNAAAMGRCETDLIVITPRRVVVLEVKNWSGSLRVQGNQWVQTQRSGNQLVHQNLLLHNRDKLRVLRQYLLHKGVNLPAERFHQAVVFANPRLDIDPTLRGHPAVLEFDSLDSVLGEGTSAARVMAARVVEKLAGVEAASGVNQTLLDIIPPSEGKAAAAAIAELRTWDRIALRGGRVLQGDVLWLRIHGTHCPAEAMDRGGIGSFYWRRDRLGGILWVVMNGYPGYMEGTIFGDQHRIPRRILPVDLDACAYFHEVGAPKPSIVALTNVERVEVG